ncbi:MAG TPA: hypothetical protein VE546_26295 [Streptomyces sp.]|nr:hypothetical protein [Streptomyces sp.]HZG07035.1 hypothetical protein [Streptomyces sp.]
MRKSVRCRPCCPGATAGVQVGCRPLSVHDELADALPFTNAP